MKNLSQLVDSYNDNIGLGEKWTLTNDIEVCGTFLIDAFVKIGNSLYRIKGIKYEHVPIIRGIENFIIESKGKAVLLIKSELDGVNKLITDFDLRAAIEQIDINGKKGDAIK